MGMGVGVDSPRETQLNSRSRNVQCTCIQACTARQMWPVSWEGVEGGNLGRGWDAWKEVKGGERTLFLEAVEVVPSSVAAGGLIPHSPGWHRPSLAAGHMQKACSARPAWTQISRSQASYGSKTGRQVTHRRAKVPHDAHIKAHIEYSCERSR